MKSNAVKRITGVMLALSLVFYTTLPVFAAGSAVEKEEVVYVKLSHDGRVDTIYVVNGFDLPQGGMITDAGHYSEIRNLTTTDALRYRDNIVSVSAPQGKFYYEGVLESREIPWAISVEYLLDGRPISGERLAGESGRLQIDLHIHHNPAANPVYADNYAIQASLSLDGETCTNIEAEDATIASVGQNKQLSYIILPGKEGDFTITADVVDFEMDGISINGIPLSLNIDDPDTGEIKDKIAELQDGAIELDDGAWELDDGVQELGDGAVELDEGATKLDDGVLSLEDGLAELDDGVEELQEGADDLRDGAHELYNGTKDLRDGVSELEDGTSKLDSGAYTFGQGLSLLNGQSPVLVEGSSAIRQGLKQINDGLAAVDGDALDTVAQQAQALAYGSDQYLASLDAMIAEYEAQLSMLRSSSRSSGSWSTPSADETDIRNQADDSGSKDEDDELQETDDNQPDEETSDTNAEEVVDEPNDEPDAEDDTEDAANFDSETDGVYYHMVATPTQATAYSLGASGLSANADMIDFLEATIQNLKMMRQSYLEIHAGIEGMESFTIGMGQALPSVSAGIGEITEQYEVLDQAVGAYTQGVTALNGSYSALTTGITDLVDGVEELMDGVKELRSGARELYDGTYDLQDGVNRLTDGAAELRDGATELRDGTIDMKDGTLELLDGVQELLDGTLELLDGTTELREKTADMDQEIDDKIDEMLEEYRGSDFDAVSFVDARNNVSSVQFVMLTEGISVDDAMESTAVEAEPAPLTLWQRFLSLFSFLWD